MDEKRVIRVFVSSTFLDMKEEREILVKKYFPRFGRYARSGVLPGARLTLMGRDRRATGRGESFAYLSGGDQTLPALFYRSFGRALRLGAGCGCLKTS